MTIAEQIQEYVASGVILSTNNLWCGGTLPKRYHERFPDTHCFVL